MLPGYRPSCVHINNIHILFRIFPFTVTAELRFWVFLVDQRIKVHSLAPCFVTRFCSTVVCNSVVIFLFRQVVSSWSYYVMYRLAQIIAGTFYSWIRPFSPFFPVASNALLCWFWIGWSVGWKKSKWKRKKWRSLGIGHKILINMGENVMIYVIV